MWGLKDADSGVSEYDYPDGTVAIKYEGTDLPYYVFDKVRQVKQADIVSNKRLGSVLQIVKEQLRHFGCFPRLFE